MIRIVNKYSLLITCLLVSVVVLADITPPVGTPPPPPPPPGFPIDNDLLILLAFGLLFGFYKIYFFTVKNKRSI
jgi:hypothetical protein